VASIILAAVITIGGTFAWFTSEDTVTNKLTATSDYGVSVVESFKTPKNLIPGQKVEKKVGVTNTGTVDAFVKVSLSNFITITHDAASVAVANNAATLPSNSTADGITYKFVELTENEIKAAKAGGRLVWNGTAVASAADSKDGTEFDPTTTGLYIFERLISTTENAGTYTYEYDGFFFVKGDEATSTPDKYYAINIPTAFVLTRNDDGTAKTVAASGVTLQQTQTITDADLIFDDKIQVATETVKVPKANSETGETEDKTVSTYYILATYCPDGYPTENHNETKDLKIRINLAEEYDSKTNSSTTWTYLAQKDTSGKVVPTFYLNSILASGATSANNLIASVEIDPSVTDKVYKNFDYNLNVKAESVQVIYNSDGSTVNLLKTGSDASVNAVNTQWSNSVLTLSTKTNTTGTETAPSQNAINAVTLNWEQTTTTTTTAVKAAELN
jgi:alternate signal-mediated exported protein